MPQQTRQLAAIMFTDIVGYTALMDNDEDAAFNLLEKNRSIHKPLINKFHGKFLKEMGDGILASFTTVTDAVYCAGAIQQACENEPELILRIGIHQGEVVSQGEDVFGSGVNIASRIEAIAPAGAIWVSDAVQRNIQNKKGIEIEFIKEEALKNVKQSIQLYEIKVDITEIHALQINSSFEPDRNSLAKSKKKLPYFIVFVVLILIALGYLYINRNENDNESVDKPNLSIVIDPSIAVLPFIDMSQGKDQEYFSDGMMEEILNHLYKIGDLKVTSRTSSMRYKNSTKSIREIGKELGVAHILEGSVRKDENNLRITVQLIDVNTDAHLWAENYDRELKNVFAIQSEVAQQIAKFLKAEISPEVEKILEAPASNNTEAYNLFLKARSLPFSSDEAIKMLHEAIKLDPNFSNAYVAVGLRLQAGATIFATGEGLDPNRAWVISKPYMLKALEVDPNNGAAHERMAWSLLWFEWDFEGAEEEYFETKRIYPNYTWTDYLVATGNFDQAVKEADLGIEFDPTSPTLWSGKILSQFFADQHEEVLTTINSASKDLTNVFKEYVILESLRVRMYLEMYEEVIESAELLKDQNPGTEPPPRLMAIASISYLHTGKMENSNEYLNMLIEKSKINAGGSPSFYTAMVYSQKGEIDEAFKWLEKSYQDHEVEMYWLKVEPPFEPIRNDPRYQEMLDRVGFPK